MDYDSTSRCYAFLGHMYYVNVDYNINVDVMGNESKMPCNRSLDGEYDECAYKMVTLSTRCRYCGSFMSERLFIVEVTADAEVQLHRAVGAGPSRVQLDHTEHHRRRYRV